MNYEDEIYHSGYLDGYYASMELYHADDSEMTDEEKARRRRRRRNIALGVGGAAALGVGGYAVGRALRRNRRARTPEAWRKLKRVKVDPSDVETPIGWNHEKNKPKYKWDDLKDSEYEIYRRFVRDEAWDHNQKKMVYDPELEKFRKKS